MRFVRYSCPRGRVSLCGLSVVAAMPAADGTPGEGLLAIIHELPENPGTSISVAIDQVILAILTDHHDLLRDDHGPVPVERIRWIERYFGIEDGVPEMLAETKAAITPTPDGWKVSPLDCVATSSLLLRHVRRELARIGDDLETSGCFNIN